MSAMQQFPGETPRIKAMVFSDPGHAWLAVPRDDVLAVARALDDPEFLATLSGFVDEPSRMTPSMAYLEEEEAMPLFQNAAASAGFAFEPGPGGDLHPHHHDEGGSLVRQALPFNPIIFDAGFPGAVMSLTDGLQGTVRTVDRIAFDPLAEVDLDVGAEGLIVDLGEQGLAFIPAHEAGLFAGLAPAPPRPAPEDPGLSF